MKNPVVKLLSGACVALLVLSISAPIAAQKKTKKRTAATVAAAPQTSANSSGESFKAGETLVYEAGYSRLLLRGIDVADLTFTVLDAAKSAPDKLQLKAEVTSKGGLLKLFSFDFQQKFDSTVQREDFRILETVRFDKQDERVRTSEAKFDYARNRVTYREIDPNNPSAPPRLISSPLDQPVQDLVSAIYYLRRQPLAVGKSLTVSMSDSGVVYQVPVKVTERVQIKTMLGKVWTLKVEPEIFGDKRPLAGEGRMIIWMTDDARRLPVRAQIHAKVGKIEIKIKQAANLVKS